MEAVCLPDPLLDPAREPKAPIYGRGKQTGAECRKRDRQTTVQITEYPYTFLRETKNWCVSGNFVLPDDF